MSLRLAAFVVLVWLLAAAGGFATAHSGRPFSNDLSALVANLEAARAADLLDRHFGAGDHETELYCVRDSTAATSATAGQNGLLLDDACRPSPGTDGVRQVDSGYLSATPRTLLLRGIDLARSVQPANLTVTTPATPSHHELERDLRRAELWSLLFTAVALLLCYRSVPVALLALASGGMIVSVTVGILTVVAGHTLVPFVAVSVASLIALALGADLASLTAVNGPGAGHTNHRSAIVGCCGVAASFGVFALFPPAGLRALALVTLIASLVALIGAWTLIPALFRLWSAVPRQRKAFQPPQRSLLRLSIRGSRRLPWVTAIGALLLLMLPAVAGFGVLRDPGSTLPPDLFGDRGTVRLQLANDTEHLLRGTVEWVIDAPRGDSSDAAISLLLHAVGQEPAFSAPVFVQWSADDQIAVVTAFAPDGEASTALAAARRAQTAADEAEVPISIGGPVMLGAQVDAILQGWSLWGAAAAAAIALLVVIAGFGTPLLSLVLIGGAALSALAGLGLLTWLSDRGVKAGPFQLTASAQLDPWTPLIVTCLVIAISTSYAGLVLGQRRRHRGTDDEGFSAALADAPQLTSAASLSIIAIGIGFTASGIPAVQQVGAGLALALAIESTLVRGVLTPALLRIFSQGPPALRSGSVRNAGDNRRSEPTLVTTRGGEPS